MKCVIDSSAISWMEEIKRLKLLSDIYETMYIPPAVYEELAPHDPVREFLQASVVPLSLQSERKRFDMLVRRWQRRHDFDDVADLEVFIGYKFFSDADEALYANKHAEETLAPYGHVRDIARLYEPAEKMGLFTRKDSIEFLESLLKARRRYRPQFVRNLLSQL